MIELKREAHLVPEVDVAGKDALAVGSVYVADGPDDSLIQVVSAGKKAVLEVGKHKLELTTSDYAKGSSVSTKWGIPLEPPPRQQRR